MWYEPDIENQMRDRFTRCVRNCKRIVENHGILSVNDFRGGISTPSLMRHGHFGPQWSCEAYNRPLWQNGHSEQHMLRILLRKYLNALGHAVTGNTEYDLNVARNNCMMNKSAYKIQHWYRTHVHKCILKHIEYGLPVKVQLLSKCDGRLSMPDPSTEYSFWKYKNMGKGVHRMYFKYLSSWKIDTIYCNKWYVEYHNMVPKFYVYDSEHSAARVFNVKITTVNRKVPLLSLPISLLEHENRLKACKIIQYRWRRYLNKLSNSAFIIQTFYRMYCVKIMRPFSLVPKSGTDNTPYIGKANLKLSKPWVEKPSFKMIYFYVNDTVISPDCYKKGGPNGPTKMKWTFDILNRNIHWFYKYGFELKTRSWEYGKDFSIRIVKLKV